MPVAPKPPTNFTLTDAGIDEFGRQVVRAQYDEPTQDITDQPLTTLGDIVLVWWWEDNPETHGENFGVSSMSGGGVSLERLFYTDSPPIPKVLLGELRAKDNFPAYESTPVAASALIGSFVAVPILRVHPTNPRYFTDDTGRAIYLAGSNYFWNVQDGGGGTDPPAVFNYTTYLDTLVSYGHNCTRFWHFDQARDTSGFWYITPHPWNRNGVGTAADGKQKFDLNSLNQTYFDRLRDRIAQAQAVGVYVIYMFFSVSEDHWIYHPFNAGMNSSGINPPSGQSIQTWPLPTGVWTIQQAYIEKVIQTVNLNNLNNVIYEVVNESGSYSTTWQGEVINKIRIYEQATYGKQRPTLMSWQAAGYNSALFASTAESISPGATDGPAGNTWDTDPPASDGSKVIVADTDHIHPPDGTWATWAWKILMRGSSVAHIDSTGGFEMSNPPPTTGEGADLRRAMGRTREYAEQIDLANMVPQAGGTIPCSTGYALSKSKTYLLLQPGSGAFTATLDAASYNVEWYNPVTGLVISTVPVTSTGTALTLTPPFTGTAVAYITEAAPAMPLPGSPSNLQATVSGLTITFTWTAAPDATSHVIYGFDRSAGNQTVIYAQVGTSHTYTGILNHTYGWTVKGRNAVGDGPEVAGPDVTITAGDTTPPTTPEQMVLISQTWTP